MRVSWRKKLGNSLAECLFVEWLNDKPLNLHIFI